MAIRPFPIQIEAPPPLGTDKTKTGNLWLSVEKTVQVIRALLSGKLFEYHEDEYARATGQSITHNLGRIPRGYILTCQEGNRVVFSDRQRWTRDRFYLAAATGEVRVSFFLFALLAALLSPQAQAAECAAFGYTQGDVVGIWVCALDTDTTSTAAEGDLRYNKNTDAVQSFDGASWADVGGGGGGAPTTATYITQTANGILSAEQAMSATGTGLVFNTVGTGVLSQFLGSGCAGTDKATGIGSDGVLTCSAVAYGNVTGTPAVPTGTGFSHVTAGSLDAASELIEFADTAHVKSGQGTATTVLHGGAGQPSFGAVALGADVSGTLGAANGGTGADSSGSTGVPRVAAGSWAFNAGISHLSSSTSAQLRTVLSDETGTGDAMFGITAAMGDEIPCSGGQAVRRTALDAAWECYTPSTGGAGNSVEVSLDVSGGAYFSVSVSAAWVAADSEIVCRPFGTTADSLTPEAIAISGIQATASARDPGAGFLLLVSSPYGLAGTVRFHCVGV